MSSSSAVFPFSDEGDGKFDMAFVTINLIGTGLSLFVALQWQSTLSKGLARWEEPEKNRSKSAASVWKSFAASLFATVLAVVLSYLMFKAYHVYQTRKSQ